MPHQAEALGTLLVRLLYESLAVGKLPAAGPFRYKDGCGEVLS